VHEGQRGTRVSWDRAGSFPKTSRFMVVEEEVGVKVSDVTTRDTSSLA
jgi:hypothetical protein